MGNDNYGTCQSRTGRARSSCSRFLRPGATTVIAVVFAICAAAAPVGVPVVHASAADLPLALVTTIPLEGVRGRIDHLAVDQSGAKLYVAALGNGSVEVVDLKSGRREASVTGFKEPQGIAVVPWAGEIAVANGEGSGIDLRASDDLHQVKSVALGDDSDNVRVDAAARRIYVGYASGAIAAIDAAEGRKLGEVAVGGHPESFQLEAGGPRLFVNVPDARRVSVIDRTAMKVTATWPLPDVSANYPMALDERGHRLFVGCRRPPVVLVLDDRTGKVLARATIAGDTDDLFFDERRQRLYVSAGEGFLDVLQAAGGELRRTAHIPTAPGARTSLFVPASSRLYLAVPTRGGRPAAIRVYEAKD